MRPPIQGAAKHRRGIEPQHKGALYWGLTDEDIKWAHERWLSGLVPLATIAHSLRRFREGKRDAIASRTLKLEFIGMGFITILSRGEKRRLREVRVLRHDLADKYDLIVSDLLWGILKFIEVEDIDIRVFVETIGVEPGEEGLRSLKEFRRKIAGLA